VGPFGSEPHRDRAVLLSLPVHGGGPRARGLASHVLPGSAHQPDAPGSGTRPTQTRVYLASASPGSSVPSFERPLVSAVRPNGTFDLSGVRGPVQIGAQGGRAALESVTRGGRDISGQPLELLGTERIDDKRRPCD